jgi:dimethylargininase
MSERHHTRAILRAFSPALGRCELTFIERRPIDASLAAAQHLAYQHALERAGIDVEVLSAEEDLPDAAFVEDIAVVLDEVAIVTRPGSAARRREARAVARVLSRYRGLHSIRAPGTLDGGDVLRIGRECFVGLSARTNEHGIEQFARIVGEYGYGVDTVPVNGCLHLKTAVTALSEEIVLINPRWTDASRFGHLRQIEVPADEPFAANALVVNGAVHLSASWPVTQQRVQDNGVPVNILDVSEFEKAEAGLTCLSLIFGTVAQ